MNTKIPPGDAPARIIAFLRRVQDRSATRREAFPGGTALLNGDFPLSWLHNRLRVEGEGAGQDAPALAALAAGILGEAGHPHRCVWVESGEAGARLSPGFAALGWQERRELLMVHRRPAERPIASRGARELDWDLVRPLHQEAARRLPYGGDEETVRQLVDRTLLVARAARLRHFGVQVDGRVVSACNLYQGEAVAQIQDVETLEEHRGRGYAQAVVWAALEAARRDGCEICFLTADAEDWPQQLYRRMGFEALSCCYEFTRPPETPAP